LRANRAESLIWSVDRFENMNPRTRKTLAIAWLSVAIPFGGVAAFHFYCLFAGIYDPVAHDQMRPESVPGLRAWLIGVIAASFASSLIAGWYVRHASQRAP
jgi:hypothetical protein